MSLLIRILLAADGATHFHRRRAAGQYRCNGFIESIYGHGSVLGWLETGHFVAGNMEFRECGRRLDQQHRPGDDREPRVDHDHRNDGKMSGSTSLNVTAATLVVIDLSPTNASLANGLTGRFVATGVYTDNSVHDITASATWSSSVNTVAAISNTPGSNGMTTTASPGATMISATLGAVSASTPLTVTSATLVSIEVTPTNPSIASGLSEALQATGIYTDHSTHDLTNSVIWSSSVASVASVGNTPGSNGLAATLSPGSTTITATLGGISGSTNLTVTAATLVSLGVTPPNPSIAKGLKSQFTAIGTYTDNSMQNLTAQVAWSSSDPTVATVSNALGYAGLGVGLNPGSVTITEPGLSPTPSPS